MFDGEVSRVFASRPLAVVEMAVCQTGYSNCLNGFSEPLSPPYTVIDVTLV